jgi:peptidoglycan/xylan/chitin deacetylase (PgdA/CDA1 family)
MPRPDVQRERDLDVQALIASSEREGARCAETFLRDPVSVTDSSLGSFNSPGGERSTRILRALIALRIPPRWLLALRPLIRDVARMDPFVARYAFWRGVRQSIPDVATWRRLTQTPIILMYHGIGRRGEHPSTYVVGRWRFRCQMAWLYWRGYRAVTVSHLTACLAARQLLPPRTLAITFDDAYEDVYREAFPVLRRYGFDATIFVVSGSVGKTAAWASVPPLAGRAIATQSQLQEMAAAGIEIGAHTASHPSLTSLPPAAQQAEIVRSRTDLERLVDRPIRSFAYPFGNYNDVTAAAVRSAGFHAACGSRSGRNDPATPLFELRRTEVRGTDSFACFVRMLASGRRAPRRRMTRPAAQVPA